MSSRSFRVMVRGFSDGLSAGQRAELLARAAEHDVLDASFTKEGHLSYDIAARDAFTFRFLDSGEDILLAAGRAEDAARAWLTGRGYGFKHLRSQAEDLSQMPLSKRQRRALAGGQGQQLASPEEAVLWVRWRLRLMRSK
jgi:hypothetical protein